MSKKSLCSKCRQIVTEGCERNSCPKNSSKFRNKRKVDENWYNLSEWKGNPNKLLEQRTGLRAEQLKRKPNCEDCEERGVINQATVVDHIEEWRNGKTKQQRWELFTDPENHRSLCSPCHNAKTGRTNKTTPGGQNH